MSGGAAAAPARVLGRRPLGNAAFLPARTPRPGCSAQALLPGEPGDLSGALAAAELVFGFEDAGVQQAAAAGAGLPSHSARREPSSLSRSSHNLNPLSGEEAPHSSQM